jgi:hypothetical protein
MSSKNVTKVASDLFFIVEIKSIVQFSKFEYDFNSFWLICSRQTAMLFAAENSITAFIDQMWADRIESVVQCLVPTLLFG